MKPFYATDLTQDKNNDTLNGDIFLTAKPHYILQFYHNGEQWGIYFPCYELNTFEKVTGLKAQ